MTKITGTLREDRYTLLIIHRSVLLRIKTVSDKFEKKIKIRILCSIKSYFLYPLYEIKWKNTVGPISLQLTIQRMHIAYWIINPLNVELNPICHLLVLLGAHPILHISRIRVKAINKGLRWSRGSVLTFGTQVRGFTPGEKILSTPSFGGEVKLSVPCRSFTAGKRSLNITW